MVKTWSADNPKAALMTQKRDAIVGAALSAFLDTGYAEASVNRIAAAAGVSIKTLYRHFESKDELFSAVMQAACAASGSGPGDPAWYAEPPAIALPLAGAEYLRHALSPAQLALYRVVTRDADRFRELGRRYHAETVAQRVALVAGYLDRWSARAGWPECDPAEVGRVFEALLQAGIFEAALHGLNMPDEGEIQRRSAIAAARLLILLKENGFRAPNLRSV